MLAKTLKVNKSGIFEGIHHIFIRHLGWLRDSKYHSGVIFIWISEYGDIEDNNNTDALAIAGIMEHSNEF